MKEKQERFSDAYFLLRYVTITLSVFCFASVYHLSLYSGRQTIGTLQETAEEKNKGIKRKVSTPVRPGLGRWVHGKKYKELEPKIPHCHGVCNITSGNVLTRVH